MRGQIFAEVNLATRLTALVDACRALLELGPVRLPAVTFARRGCTLDLDPLDPSCVPVPSAVPSATTWGDAAHGADGFRVVRVTAATPADNRCSFSIGGGRHCAGSEGEVNVMHSAAGRHDLQPAAIFGLGHVPPKDPQCIAHHFSIGCRLRISPDLIESLLGFW